VSDFFLTLTKGFATLHFIQNLNSSRPLTSTQLTTHHPHHRPQTPAYTLFATHKSSQEAISRGKAPDFTGILLTLIRLEAQKTDLVICVNVPHVDGEYNTHDVNPSAGKQGPMLDAATSFRDRILQSFEIKDWELFVQE
jgi:hypothetical protein